MRDLATDLRDFFDANTAQYQIIYFLMVVAFTYFYTMVVFQQQRIAENFNDRARSSPASVQGRIRTAISPECSRDYVGRGVLPGVIAVLPYVASQITGVQTLLLELHLDDYRRRGRDRHDAAA